jgi:Protein of unknown function (DUF2612)
MDTVAQLVLYYQQLLILQYANQPKAVATIGVLVDEILQNGLIFQLETAFDLDTAVGAQLDILGQYIGVTRYYKAINFPAGYFGFVTTSNQTSAGQKGFCLSSTFNSDTGNFLTTSEVPGNDQQLSDDNYRVLLQFQIICNSINMSQKSIDDALFQFFGNNIILTSANNMVISYIIYDYSNQLIQVLIQKGVLPKPLGVRLGRSIVPPTNKPYFGFSLSTSDPASSIRTGFTLTSTFLTKQGQYLLSSDII